MNASEQSLYDRILRFSFDDGDEDLTFSLRLARENQWTQDYATRVIDEYKRFVFLASAAGHPVTPSDQVDQVWHLHLTYTKSYWEKLCGQVLGTPLHHGPTRGGTEEADKFDRWYRSTIESYTRFFGHEPPAQIWPDPSVRFGQDLHFQRVNTKQNWVVRKPRNMGAAITVMLGVLFILLVVASELAVGSLSSGSNRSWVLASYREAASTDANTNGQLHSPLLANGNFFPLQGIWIFAPGIAFLACVAVAFVLLFAFGRRCSRCKQRRALEKTGRTQGGSWSEVPEREWRCKFCGHREWKKDDGGYGEWGGGEGGGGCGGGGE